MKLRKMMLNINGVDRMFMCDPENDKLSDVLRRIGLTGVKVGCGTGVCGSCSIILNGQVIRSCTKKISQVEEYSKITTIEGIGTPQHLHPLQVAWMNCGAVQCGFCVPGFIVSRICSVSSRTRIRPVKRFVTGSRRPEMSAAAQATSRSWTPSWRRLKVMRGECASRTSSSTIPRTASITASRRYARTLGKVCGLADYGDDQALKMPQEPLYAAIVQPKAGSPCKDHRRYIPRKQRRCRALCKVITAKDIIAGRRNQHHGRGSVPREKYGYDTIP